MGTLHGSSHDVGRAETALSNASLPARADLRSPLTPATRSGQDGHSGSVEMVTSVTERDGAFAASPRGSGELRGDDFVGARQMIRTALRCFGFVLVGVLGPMAQGCGPNPCDQYAQDVQAKYQQCGIAIPGGDTGNKSSCSASEARTANCYDACLSKVCCECTKEPTAPGCAAQLQPYSDCVAACASTQ